MKYNTKEIAQYYQLPVTNNQKFDHPILGKSCSYWQKADLIKSWNDNCYYNGVDLIQKFEGIPFHDALIKYSEIMGEDLSTIPKVQLNYIFNKAHQVLIGIKEEEDENLPIRVAQLFGRKLTVNTIKELQLGYLNYQAFEKYCSRISDRAEYELAQQLLQQLNREDVITFPFEGGHYCLWNPDAPQKYIFSPEWQKKPLILHYPHNHQIHLVEGIFDGIALYQKGYSAMVLWGLSFNPDWFELIPEDVDIVLSFDNDIPGKNGVEHFLERHLIECCMQGKLVLGLVYPDEIIKDPDELIRQNGEIKGSLTKIYNLLYPEDGKKHVATGKLSYLGYQLESKFTTTDLALTELLEADYPNVTVFLKNYTNAWYKYETNKWVKSDHDITRAITNIAKRYQKLYWKARNYFLPESKAKNEWEKYLEYTGINQATKLAQKLDCFEKQLPDFDSKGLLFFPNGCLDLKSGEFHPPARDNYNLKLMGCEYDPNAKCPVWLQTLENALPNVQLNWKEYLTDQSEVYREIAKDYQAGNNVIELQDFLQEFLGYMLMGDPQQELMIIAYGEGKNGKSTVFNNIESLLGDYAGTFGASVLTSRDVEQPGVLSSIARLANLRFAVFAEAGSNSAFNEETIKRITSTDMIEAKFMGKEKFNFRPTHTSVLFSNTKPTIRGTDLGIWRRVALLPFERVIQNPNRRINELLKQEYSGIFNWLYEGFKRYQTSQLRNLPKAVIEATQQYQYQNDVVQQFIDEVPEHGNNVSVGSSILYEEYQTWCGLNGYKGVLSHRKFSQELKKKKYQIKMNSMGIMEVQGLTIRTLQARPAKNKS